jgi:hypothetical protein
MKGMFDSSSLHAIRSLKLCLEVIIAVDDKKKTRVSISKHSCKPRPSKTVVLQYQQQRWTPSSHVSPTLLQSTHRVQPCVTALQVVHLNHGVKRLQHTLFGPKMGFRAVTPTPTIPQQCKRFSWQKKCLPSRDRTAGLKITISR